MKTTKVQIIILVCAGFGLQISRGETPSATATAAKLREDARQTLACVPAKAPGSEKDSADLIGLGKKLYFDKKLSANNTMSCNSCHAVDKNRGGVDNEPTSPGAFGKRGGRNSPTVLNAALQFSQFWDGRAATLEHQAKGPILNPIEMAMPSDTAVLERLKESKEYDGVLKKAFPGEAAPLTYDNLAKAIAAYERTLLTRDRFDDFLNGQDKALNEQELRGLETFVTVGCTACHNGPAIGGTSYQKVGLVKPLEIHDKGRFDVTKDDDDKFKFKVPMLRNIELTGPYFHDGSVKSLEEVVKKMGWHQLGVELKEEQIKDLVAFLKTLTDKPRATAARKGGQAGN
jgi:cytochrome c peroxidase